MAEKMSKEQLLECAIPIISKIAKNRKSQKFAYYQGEDIEQEVWVFCLQAMQNYDPDKTTAGISLEEKIERFLNHHVTNRLKNLMRDKYFRPEKNTSNSDRTKNRINLINALPIDNCDINGNSRILGSANRSFDPIAIAETQELEEKIFVELPEHLLMPFVDLLCGNKIKKAIEMELQEKVVEILQGLQDE
jgi:hypothetical protein